MTWWKKRQQKNQQKEKSERENCGQGYTGECCRFTVMLLVISITVLITAGCARDTSGEQESESSRQEKLQIGMSFD